MNELTYEDLTRELFPRLAGSIHWGLERTLDLLHFAGNPHHSFRSIHVGGTNGKGSVAATLEAILRADGRAVGLYSSPHLCTFRERVQINGRAIGEAGLLHAARRLWPEVERVSATFFEATTAIAFLALAEAGVPLAVVEVGLGGSLDATNVITPELAIITNIAFDHAEYLGNTIESIASEKAGIIKPATPILTAESDPAALAMFAKRARAVEARLHLLTADEITNVAYDLDGTRFELVTVNHGRIAVSTPLIGGHQASNVALAVRAAELLPTDLRPSLESTLHGAANVRWSGRLQAERLGDQLWLFDVAHNVAGVHALAAALQGLELARPVIVIIGILGDKDWQAMLPPLFEIADLAVLTRPPTAPAARAWDPQSVLSTLPFQHAVVLHDFNAALEHARDQAGTGTVLVTGSFHTVGDALIALDRAPYGSDTILPHATFSG